MPQTVWITRTAHMGNTPKLHVDPTCYKIKSTTTIRGTTRDAHPNKRLCKVCSDAECNLGGATGTPLATQIEGLHADQDWP